MQAAYSSRPSHPVLRATAAGVLVVFIALFGLAFFPSLLNVLAFVLVPAGAAFAFAGPPPDRDTFVANAFIASLASGITGAAWLGARADDSQDVAAVGIGAFISFMLLVLFAGIACFCVARWLAHGEAAEARAHLYNPRNSDRDV